ncbi:MAG: glycosyl hydrolase family protein, partial [Actinobacteria bacterium]|nr:glycosyl hydrolase family protein [Actinomycetota bacterium]
MTASKHPPSRLRRGGALATVAALTLTMMGALGAANAETEPFVITFDEDPLELIGFGLAEGTLVEDPTDDANTVMQVIKSVGAETWAGVTVATNLDDDSVPVIPFTDDTTMTVRVWSPAVGTPVLLKVEDASDKTVSVETLATTTMASKWETLTFDFANPGPNTKAIDPTATYNKVSIFFDFGTAPTEATTYYADDITWPTTASSTMVVDDFESPLVRDAVETDTEIPIGFYQAQSSGSTLSFDRTQTPPAPVPGSADGNWVLQMDYTTLAWAVVVHAFEDSTGSQWVTQDWSGYEGFQFELYGHNSGIDLFIDVIDNRTEGSTIDDAERWTYAFVDDVAGWRTVKIPFTEMKRKDFPGAPNDGLQLTEVHGWAFGTLVTPGPLSFYVDNVSVYGEAVIPDLAAGFTTRNFDIPEGETGEFIVRVNRPWLETDPDQFTVDYSVEPGSAVPDRDFTPTSGKLTFTPDGPQEQTISLETFDNDKNDGDKRVIMRLSNPVGAADGFIMQAAGTILDDEPYDPRLLDDFERAPDLWDASDDVVLTNPEIEDTDANALPEQGEWERVLEASVPAGGGSFGRDFALGEDWSNADGLTFWYEGSNSGGPVTVELLDNRALDPGPDKWKLVWADEFNDPVGTPPNPDNWGYEIGDGTIKGIPGWGNDEFQYYTDSTDNAATDGDGNLVITLDEADGEQCYYGDCLYTSARLLTKHKAEFAYGRIEASIEVPGGGPGLWPAFWSLGTDIDQVDWPQTGEIDFMEYVSRLPNEVYGTVHGPGYSGGASIGDKILVDGGVAGEFHKTTIEWEPDSIKWYLNDVLYHEVSPEDVPGEWVFNHPFFLLLNMAIGGNFGGTIDPDLTFPQEMKIDYVRVYQGPDTAERFEASFMDDFTGWKQINVPFGDFTRSVDQPAGAPNDGLGLDEVWGYGFSLNGLGTVRIDQVRLDAPPPPPPAGFIITFDEVPEPVLTGFGGADDSKVVTDPTDASNKVMQVIKAEGSEVWAGTTVSTLPNFSVPVIPFTADDTTMTVRVWSSPDAGIPVRLKVENAADPADAGIKAETEATTTVAPPRHGGPPHGHHPHRPHLHHGLATARPRSRG